MTRIGIKEGNKAAWFNWIGNARPGMVSTGKSQWSMWVGWQQGWDCISQRNREGSCSSWHMKFKEDEKCIYSEMQCKFIFFLAQICVKILRIGKDEGNMLFKGLEHRSRVLAILKKLIKSGNFISWSIRVTCVSVAC